MRIPYASPTPPSTSAQSVHDIYARVAARRAPRPLIPLDLALLHNPSIADGWNTLLGAVRSSTSLGADVVEFAVCRIAVLNRAAYEWESHAPLARKAGVSKQAMGSVLKLPCLVGPGRTSTSARARDEQNAGNGKDTKDLNEKQFAVLQYTDSMTRNVEVEDAVFEKLKSVAGFDDKQIAELTAVVASYNMVSRFLVALDVGEKSKDSGEMIVPE